MSVNLSIRQWALTIVGLVLVAYVLFQARFLILGPRITIDYPFDGTVVHESLIQVQGRAYNIAWISLNGKQIYTDAEGRWEETLLVSPGVSIMTVSVRDRFGREREESVRVIYNQ